MAVFMASMRSLHQGAHAVDALGVESLAISAGSGRLVSGRAVVVFIAWVKRFQASSCSRASFSLALVPHGV